MATYISKATGNFTATGTWAIISSAANAELDSEAGNTASTTSYVYSATFTPTNAAVDGIAVKVASRVASPTGTISITLANNTSAGTREGTVTLNVSDLANLQNLSQGWIFFKFAASVTPNGTDVYKIGFKTSVNAEVSLYRNATAGNWSRMLRLTTSPGALSAGDKFCIMGEWAAGTPDALTSYTVTMDGTATTSWGPTVSGGPPQGMTISAGGTLQYGTTGGVNYYLKLKGILAVYAGGTLNIGTSITGIPSNSTAVLEFDASATNVDSGLRIENDGTLNVYGASKTSWTYLTADKTASGSPVQLAVVDTTGWAASDTLAIASTSRTASEAESKAISSVDDGTHATVATLTNNHSGTSPTRAEVLNLTRNVVIRGVDSTHYGYLIFLGASTVTMRYAEMTQVGSTTANKRGVDIQTVSGSCDIQYCALHDSVGVSSPYGFYISGNTANNITISNNAVYNQVSALFYIAATSGTSITVDNNAFCKNTNSAGSHVCDLNDIGITFTNNVISCATGLGANLICLSEVAVGTVALGTISGNICHTSGNTALIELAVDCLGTISNMTVWRGSGTGLRINASQSALVLDGWTMFGNTTSNIFQNCAIAGNITFNNLTSNGDTTFATVNGIVWSASLDQSCNFLITNSDFSTVTGIKTAHTYDIAVPGSNLNWFIYVNVINTKLGAATQVYQQSPMGVGAYVKAQRLGQVAATHKSWFRNGTVEYDTGRYHTASPAEKLTPSTAAAKLESGHKLAVVNNGATVTFSVYVWQSKNASGDSADYGGNKPRLILKANPALGVNSDTVLATAAAAIGNWELLSGTTAAASDDGVYEAYVDCDGTTGFVSVDDWTAV